MGIFSKLKSVVSGQPGESDRARWSAGSDQAVLDRPLTPVTQPASGAAAGTTQDPLFTPPEAWNLNTGALTAPIAAPEGDAPQVGPVDPAQTAAFQQKIIDAAKTVFDPEIPVDIYELGLIYDIIVDAEKRALIKMTLTSPACPSAQQLPSEVRFKVKAVPGITDAWVEIVWEPPWDKERMSEAAKLQLGFF